MDEATTQTTEEAKRKKRKWWLLVLLLLLLVALTAAYLCVRLGIFFPTEREYIPLVPTDTSSATEATEDSGGTSATDPTGTTGPTEPAFVAQPGMEVSDDKQTWSTNTKVDLFSVAYENGQAVYTVVSDDSTKLIAPGTENSYSFRLKNTGNVALNYSVMLRAYFSDNTELIPVQVRMCNYYGRYIIGSEAAYAPVRELDGLQDHATLGVGAYACYTLEWQWPFESGDDALDTALGDLAATEPVTLTIEIHTLASQCDDPDATGGMPATGDTFQPVFWGLVCGAAVLGIVLLLILGRRRREEKDED